MCRARVDLPGASPTLASVTTVFFWCAVGGAAVLLIQLIAGLVGLEHGAEHDVPHGGGPTDGLDILSIRSVAAGAAFFGFAGLAARPLGAVAATLVGLAAGVAATFGVALLVRTFRRFEHDGTLSLQSAVGATGTVYLSIPGHRSGTGKVHVTVQNRLIECSAVTSEETVPTGASVLVIDVQDNDTLVVVRTPILLTEVSNAGA